MLCTTLKYAFVAMGRRIIDRNELSFCKNALLVKELSSITRHFVCIIIKRSTGSLIIEHYSQLFKLLAHNSRNFSDFTPNLIHFLGSCLSLVGRRTEVCSSPVSNSIFPACVIFQWCISKDSVYVVSVIATLSFLTFDSNSCLT